MNQHNDPSRKSSDSRGAPAGGNLIWYLVILGVSVLLFTTYFINLAGDDIGFTDLIHLIEASRQDGESGKTDEGASGKIVIDGPKSTKIQHRHDH